MNSNSLSDEVDESLFLELELETSPRLVLVVFPPRSRGDEMIAYWRRADAFLAGIHTVEVGRA